MRILALSTRSPSVASEALPSIAQGVAAAPFDLGAVYTREFDWVWHTLRRLGIAHRNLPDVTHDVFVVVHQRAFTYDPSRPLRPWLFGVAYRVARDHLSLGRNHNESVCEAIEMTDSAPSQEHHVAQSQAREVVIAALRSLDMEHRAVFLLHDLEEQPMREISDTLAVPAKTLYARLKVAREQFSAAVRRLRAQRGERP